MDTQWTCIERAFQLAEAGDHATVSDIRKQLRLENYSTVQLVGPSLMRQLQAICAAHRKAPA